MVYGYARVSTKGQAKDGTSLDAQEQELRQAGAEVIFKDVYTGKTMDRPAFSELMNKLAAGDKLIVCKLDRFARTAQQGLDVVEELMRRQVTVHILNMGMINGTPMGKLLLTTLLAFAEFERNMICERMMAGKEASGNWGGRPNKYGKAQIAHALELLQDYSYTEIEKMTGISKSTLIRAARKQGCLKNQTAEDAAEDDVQEE